MPGQKLRSVSGPGQNLPARNGIGSGVCGVARGGVDASFLFRNHDHHERLQQLFEMAPNWGLDGNASHGPSLNKDGVRAKTSPELLASLIVLECVRVGIWVTSVELVGVVASYY